MNNKELFLENAYKIGKKICEQALWKEDKCTWQIVVPDSKGNKSRSSHYEKASGELYMGTAGISVFLTELYKHTPDELIKKTAVGAANKALAEVKKLPLNSFGFHTGRVGIAYALNKAGDVFGNNEFINSSREIIIEMRGYETKDTGIDVISGGGGSIPVVLQLAKYFNDQNIFEIAIALGDNLIRVANRELVGWSWGSNYNIYPRYLCGYAHGASGIGHALLELYNATGSDYYLYPAEQAFLYERQFYSEKEKNWPDFRHIELGLHFYKETFEQMRTRALNNEFPKYSLKYMPAWCHGAPGIGLARLRAFDLLKKEIYEKEASNAVENTILTLNKNSNYSLCHGAFGNAETLLYAYNILGDKKYYDIATEIAVKGIEESQKQNGIWKCGTINTKSDPSFMLGEAGIGYYLLRLADKNIESVLAPTTNGLTKQEIVKQDTIVLVVDSLKKYLFRTISLLECNEVEKFISAKASQNTIFSLLEMIDGFYEVMFYNEKTRRKQKLLDESRVIESRTIGLLKANDDYTSDYVYSLTTTDFEFLDKEKTVLKLHHLCVPIELAYNWNEFGTDKFPEEEDGSYLLFIQKTKPFLKKLNLLSKLIIDEISNEIVVAELVEKVTDNFDLIENDQKKELEERISLQLKELYNANIIVAELDTIDTANTITSEARKCDHCEKHAVKL